MRRRGFTLLEVLVAMAILASLVTLIAQLWAQVNGWSDAHRAVHADLRLARLERLVSRQWRSRVAIVPPDAETVTPTVYLDAATLRFATAEPVLLPGAALVVAEYTIEPAPGDTAVRPGTPRRIVYRETPLPRSDRVPERSPGAAALLPPHLRPAEEIALEGLDDPRWERWAFEAFVADRPADEEDGLAAAPSATRTAAPRTDVERGWQTITPGWAFDPAAQGAESLSETGGLGGGDAAGTGPASRPAGSRGPGSRGPAPGETPPDAPDAVRLVGRHHGKEFSWLFAGETDSR